MYKLKKNGLVRIVATEAELKRWQRLGYEIVGQNDAEPEVPATPEAEQLLDDMDAEALKEYAVEHGIDIGNATSQPGILKKIREAQPPAPESGEA